MGQIETALVSVYDKTGLVDFAKRLVEAGVKLVASGGTGAYLKRTGVTCEDISSVTGKVELLGGLVKTLHPAIHAGILADRASEAHMAELAALGYRKIDMVVVDFYALPEAPRIRDLSFIDIGGPAMARAAAKNFRSCVPVADPSWYEAVAGELEAHDGIGEDLRWRLAADALARTGNYDARVLALLGPGFGPGTMDAAAAAKPEAGEAPSGHRPLLLGFSQCLELRYGENPHQQAGFFTGDGRSPVTVVKGTLSYNNILDVDCCFGQLAEFEDKAAVVVKHAGPCGVSQSTEKLSTLEGAFECDPVSAFGGVVGVNFRFDKQCAEFLAKRFVECIVAPEFDTAALAVLDRKKARLVAGLPARTGMFLRSALGGVLAQSRDAVLLKEDLKFVSGECPPADVLQDLIFAWKVVKHVRSNAIVFAKGGRTLGIGAGQPSRVDSTRLAIMKASQAGHDLKGSVMASDGFFPFPDSVELAAGAGAIAIVQPGGSIRDDEVVEAAKKLGVVMALTSIRHFKH